ncbi:YhcB family protein [Candidatus Litorirhabdus singularis]|uniref:YhcB family protein n=1 Tax=Candidatus Litorirhabdus singularis TaxID=2518993 RepID=UPI00242B1FC5|nr:DUF1043 family protein [Candidatus Litorirhabdus singularis]
MYSDNTLILAIIIALLLGLGVGAFVSRRLSPDTKRQRELERNLERALEQQRNYQLEVSEHFADTGKLLGTLAQSYRNVHNHLAEGADRLTGAEQGPQLTPLPDFSIDNQTATPVTEASQPPLDYAPKISPHEPGMLNEEFGLDKIEPEPIPEPVIDTQPIAAAKL